MVYVNSAAFALINKPRNELLGSHFIDLFSGDDNQRVCDLMRIMTTEPNTITYDAPVHLNQSQVTIDIFPLGEAESTSIIIIHDVTALRQAEGALRKAHDELEQRVEERTLELSKVNKHLKNEIEERKRTEKEREKLINELQEAINEIKTLRGILPLCSFCKKIRDDKGYWEQVDVYIDKYSEADISHGICPECLKKHYPEEYEKMEY